MNTDLRNFAMVLFTLANAAGAVVPLAWWLLGADTGQLLWEKVIQFYCGLCWINFWYLVGRLFDYARNS